MKYHGCLCPKCLLENKTVILYLNGTADGIRVFENKMNTLYKVESEEDE
jgi:hypothetical protein